MVIDPFAGFDYGCDSEDEGSGFDYGDGDLVIDIPHDPCPGGFLCFDLVEMESGGRHIHELRPSKGLNPCPFAEMHL